MNPKDQLDNNELEQNHELPGKEFHEPKDVEITGSLSALETEVKINTIKEEEIYAEKKDTIEQTREEEEKIRKEILNIKSKNQGEYIPGHTIDEENTLELANIGRKSAAQNIKDNIQKYPGWLGGLIKSIDNRS